MSLQEPFRHALPVSDAMFHGPFYLTHAGWEVARPGTPYPQSDVPLFHFRWEEGRTLPDFCLAMVAAGRGEFQTRGHREELSTGDTFLFPPGQWHRHRPRPGKGWTLYWIHFNGDDPHRWLREGSFRHDRNLAVLSHRALFRAQFEHLLESVHRAPSTNSANFSRLAIGLLAHLLTEPAGTCGRSPAGGDAIVDAAVEFIWNFSHDVVDVPAVARRAGVARRTLDRRFRAATGRSVLEEIQFCRVSRAAKLLEETTMPIKHIVHRAGFRSGEHLRVSFQQVFGRSPQAFRARGQRPSEGTGKPWAGDRSRKHRATREG